MPTAIDHPFHIKEFKQNSGIKQRERDKVLAHILKHHPFAYNMRFFGLPGTEWKFERMLETTPHTRIQFIGVEQDYAVWDYSQRHMPGLRHKHSRYEFCRAQFQGFESSNAISLNCSVDALMSTGRTTIPSRWKRMDFRNRFKNFTACWIDLFGTLETLLNSIRRRDHGLNFKMSRVPVAFTFCIAREQDETLKQLIDVMPACDPFEKRVQVVESFLNRRAHRTFEFMDAWKYGDTADTMGTITGIMVLRDRPYHQHQNENTVSSSDPVDL